MDFERKKEKILKYSDTFSFELWPSPRKACKTHHKS